MDCVMGCWQSKQDSKQVQDDVTNIVPEEENPFNDEKKKETESRPLSGDSLKVAKTSSTKERKGSKQKDPSLEKDETKRQCSTTSSTSNGEVEKKRSFINRISNFRKSKRVSIRNVDKSFASACSREDKLEISKEEVDSWSIPNNGFENMMASRQGREIFSKFLKKEFSSENLCFWTACENLRKIKDEKLFKEQCEEMFTTYLDASSPQEVSLDFKVKEKVMEQRGQPSETIFDEAQSKIYTLMHRDSFPRFLTSSFYKDLLNEDQPDSNERDDKMIQQDSKIEDEGSISETNNGSTTKDGTSDSSKNFVAQTSPSMDGESTKEVSKVPIHQDSLMDPRVIRELSKDSSGSFRTVTLDTEYDKLLNLIE